MNQKAGTKKPALVRITTSRNLPCSAPRVLLPRILPVPADSIKVMLSIRRVCHHWLEWVSILPSFRSPRLVQMDRRWRR